MPQVEIAGMGSKGGPSINNAKMCIDYIHLNYILILKTQSTNEATELNEASRSFCIKKTIADWEFLVATITFCYL